MGPRRAPPVFSKVSVWVNLPFLLRIAPRVMVNWLVTSTWIVWFTADEVLPLKLKSPR